MAAVPFRSMPVRLLALAVLLLATRVAGGSEPGLAYRDGRVTADIQGVPLEEVLAALARETGAAINGEPLFLQPVHVRLDGVPLSEALRRLLGGQNFLLRYGPDGDVSSVDLLGGPQPRTSNAGAAQVSALDFYRLVAGHPPITVGPALVKAAGGDRARAHRLLQVATHDADPAVRREALLAVLRAVEGDTALRNTALLALRRTSDASMAQLLRTHGGEHVVELLGVLEAEASDPLVRRRAVRVRGKLGAPADGTPASGGG
jgi:hypothetical protein